MSLGKQITCPPGDRKKSVDNAMNVWFSNFAKYSLVYTGAGALFGSKIKKPEKTTLGINKFYPVSGQTCGRRSEKECIGKQKYIYVKGYPLGVIPNCDGKKSPVPGKTGLIGGILEDMHNIKGTDHIKAIFGSGPYATKKCMKAKLPVGNFLLDPKKKVDSSDVDPEDLDKRREWWIEEKCIPKQTTHKVNYGGIDFDFPFSNCKEKFEKKEVGVQPKYQELDSKSLIISLLLFSIVFFLVCSYICSHIRSLFLMFSVFLVFLICTYIFLARTLSFKSLLILMFLMCSYIYIKQLG
tara:strand:+ start:5444 stop:6331 length:888 start_codon:yes stop_codon:yes gene_type:complete